MKKLLYFMLFIVICISLIGCGKSSKLVGNWEYKDGPDYQVYQFNKDGTLLYYERSSFSDDYSETYEYTVDSNIITIKEDTKEYDYEYSINDDILTLQLDGKTVMLQKTGK